MAFELPPSLYKSEPFYRHFDSDYRSDIFGCGFLNKRSASCTEADLVFGHYAAVLVLDGHGVHVDENGIRTEVSAGCLIQRIPGKVQSLLIDPDGRWLEFFICISRDLHAALVRMKLCDDRQNVLHPGVGPALLDGCLRLQGLMHECDPTDALKLVPDALKLLLQWFDAHREHFSGDGERMLMRQACALLADRNGTERSIRETADALGIGYESFRKRFRATMGLSPGSYAIRVRMDRAKLMLTEPGREIKEIALLLGFPDVSSFSRQFRKMVGVPPGAYRKSG